MTLLDIQKRRLFHYVMIIKVVLMLNTYSDWLMDWMSEPFLHQILYLLWTDIGEIEQSFVLMDEYLYHIDISYHSMWYITGHCKTNQAIILILVIFG